MKSFKFGLLLMAPILCVALLSGCGKKDAQENKSMNIAETETVEELPVLEQDRVAAENRRLFASRSVADTSFQESPNQPENPPETPFGEQVEALD